MVYSCGWNSEGQCGTPLSEIGRATFQQVSLPSGSKIVHVSAGEKHSLLLDDNGKVWAFGSNSDHQLGLDSDLKFSTSPKPVNIEISPLLLDSEMDFDKLDHFEPELKSSVSAVIKQICCGSRHSLAIDENGFGIFLSDFPL
jgi:alpha-tubulin suppressor-like RCC1 family protein